MKSILQRLINGLVTLLNQDHGQDLVEYALVIALIAFGATAGMKTLATGINTSFNTISSTLATDVNGGVKGNQ
jgi:pilus assembly protein Flp/PilA